MAKYIKKILILISVLALFSLAGCNDDDNSTEKNTYAGPAPGECTIVKGTTASTDTFNFSLRVYNSSGVPVPDAAVMVDPTIIESIDISVIHPNVGGPLSVDGLFKVDKRYVTNDQGILLIENLPISVDGTPSQPGLDDKTVYINEKDRNELVENLPYSFKIMKSGYQFVSENIGPVSVSSIDAICTINPEPDAIDMKIALYDPQIFKIATEFLVRNKIKFTDITGKLIKNETKLTLDDYKILVLGMHTSNYLEFFSDLAGMQDISQKTITAEGATKINSFVNSGGHLILFPQDDNHFVGFFDHYLFTPDPTGAYGLAFKDVELSLAPDGIENVFATSVIIDGTHPFVKGAAAGDEITNDDLKDWNYKVTWNNDYFEVSANTALQMKPEGGTNGWNRIIGAPGPGDASTSINENERIAAGEIKISDTSGYIFFCQANYPMGVLGSVVEPKAEKIAKNFIYYMKLRAGLVQ